MSEEMICKNCKYHYKEEISFDYPQSCCGKRKAVIEEWFNCNNFEYSDRYIKQLQQENKKLNGAIQTYAILLKANIEENKQLKDNWNKLKEWIVYNKHNENTEQHYLVVDYGTLLGKMQELKKGSDKNE